MRDIAYTIQVGYRNIITPQSQRQASPSSNSTPSPVAIRQPKKNIRNPHLKAIWLSLPRSLIGLGLTVATLGGLFLFRWWWHRLPLYEIDGQVIYYTPKKVSKNKNTGKEYAEIKAQHFNPVLDTLVNHFQGKKIKEFSENSFNFIQYQFRRTSIQNDENNTTKAKADDYIQGLLNFIASLPQNVFVLYVLKTNYDTLETKVMFQPNIKKSKNNNEIIPYSDMTSKEKKIIESIQYNLDMYMHKNQMNPNIYQDKNPIDQNFSYLFLK